MAIEFTIKTLRTLVSNHYGYYRSGIFPGTISYFYRVTDANDIVYTISTTQRLKEGDRIKASIKGETDFNGEHQIKLNRVSIMNIA